MSATRIRWSLVRGDSGKNSPAFACTRSSELHCKDLKPWPSGRDTFYSQVGYAKLVELRARDLTRGSIHDGMGVGTMTNRHLVFRLAVGAAMFIAVLLLNTEGTAIAADGFSFGFRGPSVLTETAQKDPMFHTEHMHDFFCANNVTDPTSYDLLVAGSTSCKRTTDHSSRWTPQLKINGMIQTPTRSGFYYQCMKPFSATQCANVKPFPKGLRFVASERPGDYGDVLWHCDITGQQNAQEDPPRSCSSDARGIGMIIRFPECWNGWTLDPTTTTEPYAVNATYNSNGKYGCPAAYPVHLPTLRFFPDYPNAPKTLNTVEVSMGNMEWGPPSTYHANNISAFTGDSMAQLTKDCITDYPLQTSSKAGCSKE